MIPKFVYVSRGTSVRFVEPRSDFSASELDDFLAANNCTDVVINRMYGMGQSNLDEALKSKVATSLSILLVTASFSAFASNELVEKVFFDGALEAPFDFSTASRISSLSLKWDKGIHGLDRMPRLAELSLSKFSDDQSTLRKLGFLKALTLVQPKLTSLGFLEAFANLNKVNIAYGNRVTNLDGLLCVAGTLEELELDHMAKLGRYGDVLSELTELRTLRVSKCPPLEDLLFVRSMPKLEFLSFVETDVVSGDITPCMGLNYVGFLDKVRYNCFWDQRENRLVQKKQP